MTERYAIGATGGRFTIVSVKAFGDLVIAVHSISRLAEADRSLADLLMGEHLRSLFVALDVTIPHRWVTHPDTGPAALFQLKARGPLPALKSALAIQKALGGVPHDGRTLVFDKLGWRERFLARGLPRRGLPAASNIYLAYERLFVEAYAATPPAPLPRAEGRSLRIFAGARAAARQPPLPVIRTVIRLGEARGWTPEVVLLDGERPDLAGSGLPIRVVPRDFRRMREAVADAGVVVSPDSMTAHLAELCRKPVFVLTPVANPYWLPLSAYLQGREGLFIKDVLDEGSLARFFDHYPLS